jgi:acetate---CoA ligase (ADP-forming)
MLLGMNDDRPAAASRFASLTPLIAPRSVAVLGASNDPARIGGRPIAYMKAQKFSGEILPVNPNRTKVQGLAAYASIAALPKIPDVAIVAVPGPLAVQAVEELGALGVRGAVVFTAGFAELGDEGATAQARMVAASRAHGMRLLGPNCLGVFNGGIG